MKFLDRPINRVIAAFIAIAIVTFAIHAMRSQVASAPDFAVATISTDAPTVVIEIPAGASGSAVGEILFQKGVVKSSLAYFRAAIANPNSNQIAAGAHRLTLSISARQAVDQLLDSSRIPNLIKIIEGGWQSEVVTSLVDYGFSKDEVAKAFKQVDLPQGFTSAEGLLFPAQYTFAKGATATQAVQEMVNRFTTDDAGKALLTSKNSLSPQQLLIIASLVQAEGDVKDFPKISRVILNRLKITMPLQLDSTVHFVKKVRGQIFLSTSSTLINSPYNTYKHYGLPPTPIGSPGAAAINAALHPVAGDWLFFITVAPGDTRFTSSSKEFFLWKALYESNRKKGAFK